MEAVVGQGEQDGVHAGWGGAEEVSEMGDAAAAAEEAQCRCPSCSAACSRALLSSGDSADSGGL